jgi:hypothetical protein
MGNVPVDATKSVKTGKTLVCSTHTAPDKVVYCTCKFNLDSDGRVSEPK